MIRTRIRKILRDIWSRKARTALVSISIFIGVFGTVTLFSMGDLLVRQLEEDLDKDELAMIRSFLGLNPGVEVDNEQALAELRALPDVTTVEGQAVYPLFWKKSGEADFRSSTVFSYSEPFEEIQLEPMRLVDGRFPEHGEDRKEIAVEQRFAEKHDLAIGDQIVLRILDGANGNGETVPEEAWTIVGTVFYPYSYAGFNETMAEDSVFATYEAAQHIAGFNGYSSFYVRYPDYKTAEARQDEFIDAIATLTPYIPAFTISEDPAQNSQIAFAQTIGNVMASLALLALVVSGFLVLNVISTIVTEQKRQIGVMKSMGATRLDNFTIYSGIALVYGVIGVVPGVALGVPCGYFAAKGMAASSNTVIEGFGYSTRAIVLGTAVGLAVPVLASVIPVFNGTRVKIIEAMTDLGISSRYGYGSLARLVGRLPVPINMRQGISNILRKKGRMALTIFTLTIAVGAFMGVFAVFTSVYTVVNDFFDAYRYHFAIMSNDSRDAKEVQAIVVDNIEGVSAEGVGVGLAINVEGYSKEYNPNTGPPALFAEGYDPASGAYQLTLDSGQDLIEAPDGVVITTSIADVLNKKPGDTITIRAAGNSADYTISGIVAFPYDSVWFAWEKLAELGGIVDEQGNPSARTAYMRMDLEDPTADEVADVLDEVNEVLLANGITASYENIELFTETLTESISLFRMIFNLAALLIALVGAIGLLSTLSMSVFERQKEIGVMRSIGAGSSTIVSQFLTEGVVVGVLAWVLGLPLSYVLSQGLIAAMNLGDAYALTYPLIAIVVGLAGMLAVTTIASIWPSVSAARRSVSDILRYQ